MRMRTVNKRFIYRRLVFMLVFMALLPVLPGAGPSRLAAQEMSGKTLTQYLKELNVKYGERVSFSPTITDKVHPYKLPETESLDEALGKLLRGTNLGFRDVNGYYYIYIKMKKTPQIVAQMPEKTEPVEEKQAEKQEEKQEEQTTESKEPLPPIESGPRPVVFTAQASMPSAMEYYRPAIKSPSFPGNPRFAVKTNLLYDAAATINLGVEFAIASNWTIDISGNYNGWTLADNRKWKHFMVQPEIRYWTCERFNGHFFGLHLHGGKFNAGNLPSLNGLMSDNMRQHRYEGKFYGAGLSYGYHIVLANRLGLEPSLGLGYARIHYDKFPCGNCGVKIKENTKNYFGPTKLSISLIYNIK